MRGALGISAVLLVNRLTCVEGLAIRRTIYLDDTCEEEISHELQFGLIALDASGSFILEPFNECHENDSSGGSAIQTCVLSTGDSGLEEYTDALCSEPDPAEGYQNSPGCVACDHDRECMVSTVCTDDVPTKISPLSTFNVKGLQFTGGKCIEPTGETEIVSTGLFGSCSPIYEGGPRYKSGCQREGLLLTQQFSADDTTCTGEVIAETAFDATTVMNTPDIVLTCLPSPVDGFYYGFYECTLDEATVGWSASRTTVPSPAPTASGRGGLTSAPFGTAPVDLSTPVPTASGRGGLTSAPFGTAPVDLSTPAPTASGRGGLTSAPFGTAPVSMSTPEPTASGRGEMTSAPFGTAPVDISTPAPTASGRVESTIAPSGITPASSSAGEGGEEEGSQIGASDTPAPAESSVEGAVQLDESSAVSLVLAVESRVGSTRTLSCVLGIALLWIGTGGVP